MKNLRSGLTFAALSLSITALALPAFGQEGSGREVVLSFEQGIELDLDRGLDTRTTLGLDFTTATRTQSLSFGLGTELFGDLSGGGSNGFEFRNYEAELRYTRRSANSRLAFTARHIEVVLGDTTFETSPGIFLIGEDGELSRTRLGTRLEFGIEGPFGLRVDADYRDADYENTVDPDLVDTRSASVDALATFRISPTLSLRARAGAEKIDEDDLFDTERENTYYGIGIGGVNRGGLTYSADIIFDETEVTTSLPSNSVTDGIGFELAATQARPDGSIGAALSSRNDDAGRRITATVSRDYELRNGGIGLSLGVVDQEGIDDLQFVGDISYRADTPRGSMSASLTQRAVSDDGDTVISTNLALNYSEEITSYSGWEAAVGYIATDELIANENENETTATFTYRQDLTPDWTMNTGLELSRTDGSSTEKTLFFNIERDFTFGF